MGISNKNIITVIIIMMIMKVIIIIIDTLNKVLQFWTGFRYQDASDYNFNLDEHKVHNYSFPTVPGTSQTVV